MEKIMKSKFIAPCGMNCNICVAFLREKNKCPGCNFLHLKKPRTRWKCVIRNCTKRKRNKWKYCSDKCAKYPCQRLKNLDKRYRTKYDMSMIENLEFIKKKGIRKFIKKEEKRWITKDGVVCVHNKKVYSR